MTFLRAPKLLLGLALVFTVGPKALPTFRVDYRTPPRQAEPQIVAFLLAHGFEAYSEQRRFGRLVHATSDECRLRVLEVDPNGSNRDTVRLIATETDRIAFIFSGQIYSDQPMVLTALSYSWTRLQSRMGLPARAAAVLGVTASQGCSLEKLPWTELADQRLVSGPA
jgi:hypothetical protein